MLLFNPKFLLLIWLICGPFDTLAQDDYYFLHYQVENGLSHNTVMCSLQDQSGFIWLGTKDGLNRFDGNAFKVFRQNESDKSTIGNDYIRCLYSDKRNRMFAGTQRGLYEYHPLTESFSHISASGQKSIKDVCVDTDGNIWFISEATLYRQSKSITKVYNQNRQFVPTAMCITSDGRFWVASGNGDLNTYDPVNDSFKSVKALGSRAASFGWIEKLYPAEANTLLLGTSAEGLYSFDIKSLTARSVIRVNQDKTGIYVRDILKKGPNEYWLATESGIFIYNALEKSIVNLKKNYHNPYSLSDNAIYTLCKDKEGGMWAGTFFGGVNYYARKQLVFQKYFPDYSKMAISGNAVREIVKDMYGNLWVGTEDAGLNKVDPTGRITHFMPSGKTNSLSYYNIHGLLTVRDTLWVGTFEHGLNLLNIKTGKVMRRFIAGNSDGALKSNFIFSLYRTKSGSILIGTTAGVYRYNSGDNSFTSIPHLTGYTYNILEDHSGVLWSATISEGIKYYDPKTGKHGGFVYKKEDNNSISNNMVNALFEDNVNNIWIATEGGGMCRLDSARKNIKRFTSKTGMPSNFVFKILQDDFHQLWITTAKGLVRFDPETETLQVYTIANGLLNDQFNYNSGYRDSLGRLYFGSVKGMVSFKPDNRPADEYNPPVVFTGFQVNNLEVPIGKNSPLTQSIIYTREIQLPYDQASFSIDFAALTHTSPQMNMYAYKMEGIDTGWTYLEKNRKVYFTDLSPGTYVFKVKTGSSTGSWNRHQASLTITITPPWWQSRPAYLIYLVTFCIVGFAAFRYYHRYIKSQSQQKINLLIVEREKEIYDAKMQFFTNIAHEIKTPLTLIKGPLERIIDKTSGIPEIKNSLTVMEKNTNRLIDLTNQLLDYRQTEAGGFTLTFEEENISKLLEEIVLSFTPLTEQKKIRLHFSVPVRTLNGYVDREVLTKILNNLISNAIKYAEKLVQITLSVNHNNFCVQISNDGPLVPDDMKSKIFEPFVRLKRTEKQQGTGIGLALAKSLTELHQGKLTMSNENIMMNTFILTLPLLTVHPHPREHTKPSNLPSVAKLDHEY